MSSLLNPYLNFRGSARDAIEFYADVLGGRLAITTYSEYGTEGSDGEVGHAQPAGQGRRLHAEFAQGTDRFGRGWWVTIGAPS